MGSSVFTSSTAVPSGVSRFLGISAWPRGGAHARIPLRQRRLATRLRATARYGTSRRCPQWSDRSTQWWWAHRGVCSVHHSCLPGPAAAADRPQFPHFPWLPSARNLARPLRANYVRDVASGVRAKPPRRCRWSRPGASSTVEVSRRVESRGPGPGPAGVSLRPGATPGSGPGLLLFDECGEALYDHVRDVSRHGSERVLAIARRPAALGRRRELAPPPGRRLRRPRRGRIRPISPARSRSGSSDGSRWTAASTVRSSATTSSVRGRSGGRSCGRSWRWRASRTPPS